MLRKSIEGIYRLKESQLNSDNPASGESQSIALYDKAFGKGQNLTRILAHEIAHEVYRQFPDIIKRDYASAADWKMVRISKTKEPISVPFRDGYVEEDGKETITEDFSNNIEYFLFNPEKLKKTSPKVYSWIERRFGDKLNLRKGSDK